MFFTLIWSFSGIMVPLVVRYVINELFKLEKERAIRMIWICIGIILILLIIIFFCNRFMKNHGRVLVAKIEVDMKNELFNHFQNLSLNFYNKNKIGQLMTLITNDTENLSALFKEIPEVALDFIVRFLGGITALFFLNITLGFVVITFFIAYIVFIYIFTPKIQKMSLLVRESISSLNSNIEENLSGIKNIQSFTNEKIEELKFRNITKEVVLRKSDMHKVLSIFDSAVYTVCIGVMPLITTVSAMFILNGGMQFGDIIAFMIYTEILLWPIWSAIRLIEQFYNNWSGYHRVYEFLQIKPEITNLPDSINLEKINGDIEFKDITFRYSEAGKNIFENLNLKIKAGEYVALVGPSGAGKSTLCNLIPRFYDVSIGKILVDGINLKNIKLKNLRQNIGFVQQDTFLFSGTIMENIRYGKIDATDNEVFEAAKNAFAHDFIMSFSDGYSTEIGQRGVKLSGGQKQRLAIARVFLKNPSILIFDEATSSLDNESEKYIQKSMKKLSEGRTTIVIAHRLSTVKNVKRILVMNRGTIVEEGNQEELIDKDGVYAKLYNLL